MRFETEDAAERRLRIFWLQLATLQETSLFCLFYSREISCIMFLCRYTGLVTGVNDMDPIRWPGSKWRCLLVCSSFGAYLLSMPSYA